MFRDQIILMQGLLGMGFCFWFDFGKILQNWKENLVKKKKIKVENVLESGEKR